MTTIEHELYNLEAQMDDAIRHYAVLAGTDSEQTALRTLRTQWADFVTRTQQELVPISRSKDIAKQFTVFNQLEQPYDDLVAASAMLVQIQEAEVHEATATIHAIDLTSQQVILGITITALAFAALLALFFSATIAGTIGRLTAATVAVAGGDFARTVVVRSRDEPGALSVAFN